MMKRFHKQNLQRFFIKTSNENFVPLMNIPQEEKGGKIMICRLLKNRMSRPLKESVKSNYHPAGRRKN